MIWKIVLFAFVAGVLAEYDIDNEQKRTLKDMATQLCLRNRNAPPTVDVETTVNSFVGCVNVMLKVDMMHKEIADAKADGTVEELLAKYCAQSYKLKACINWLTNFVSPCLDEDTIEMFKNSSDRLIDFLCYKDGYQISLFIDKGGLECFQETATTINECVDNINGRIHHRAAISLGVDQYCAEFDYVSLCIVNALQECSIPEPGSIAEDLYIGIRNRTMCQSDSNKDQLDSTNSD